MGQKTMNAENRANINMMWENGCTLGEINDKYNLVKILPEDIKAATKTTKLRYINKKAEYEEVGRIVKFMAIGMEYHVEKFITPEKVYQLNTTKPITIRKYSYATLKKQFSMCENL